jgi:hypothetical protein
LPVPISRESNVARGFCQTLRSHSYELPLLFLDAVISRSPVEKVPINLRKVVSIRSIDNCSEHYVVALRPFLLMTTGLFELEEGLTSLGGCR